MPRHRSFSSRFSWTKLLLTLALPTWLLAAVWTAYVLFVTRQIDPVLGALAFIVETGLAIWIIYMLRSSNYRWRTPSFKLVIFALVGIVLICAFAGIEPLASYKNAVWDYAKNQGTKIAESLEGNAPIVTLPQSEDTISAVEKIKPAVVMVEVEDGTGSGMIIDKLGYVLTCYHVVENAQSITVTLMDGGQYQGTVLAKNESCDLAIIKIAGGGIDFPAVTLGNSDKLEIGQEVVAVGYPLGLEGGVTVTKGIVSAFRMSEGVNYIQTDAAVNPGNSGAPLINLRGEVVGVITFKVVREAVEGMGFATAVDSAKPFITEIIEKEQAQKRVEEVQRKIEAMEREVISLVNSERSSRNISSLTSDNELHIIASEHSQEMATRGELFHSSMDKPYAENCWGGSGYWDASAIVDSWMGSDKHRTWLLCPHIKLIGVGITISDNGMYASWTFWRSETADSDWWYVNGTSPPDWWY